MNCLFEGVTIWFNQYDIAPYAAGPVSVEIPFAEGLVKQQYGTQKTSYVKELPENGTADVDVDGDGKKESVSYTVDRDEYGNGGAITVTCGDTSSYRAPTENHSESDFTDYTI